MKERNEIILRPENPDDPKGMLKNIIDAVNELIPDACDSAGNILKGIGEQKLAKVAEIKAKAYREIAEMQLANQKLVMEREEMIKRLQLQRDVNDKEHEARMYDLKTERLKSLSDVLAAVRELRDLGCEIDLRAVVKGLLGAPKAKSKRRSTKEIAKTKRKSRNVKKTPSSESS